MLTLIEIIKIIETSVKERLRLLRAANDAKRSRYLEWTRRDSTVTSRTLSLGLLIQPNKTAEASKRTRP